MDNNKLRDVLGKARLFIECSPLKIVENKLGRLERDKICAEIDSILSTPSRNCDVGMSDDWLERFNVVCERCSGSDCDHRLFKDEEICDCFARWLQMPYEEGGAK